MVRQMVIVLAVAALGVSAPATARETLKQVDPRGQIHYAEQPLPGMRVVAVMTPEEAAADRARAIPVSAAAQAAPAARRLELDWAGHRTRQAAGSMNAAYIELEAAHAARAEAEARLREAVVPLAGEAIRRPDGRLVRYTPTYYERIAPFERAAMMAQERVERADVSLAATR